MPIFSDDVVQAVIAHMNGDHVDDNVLIARAFGDDDAETAHMIALDENEGTWLFTVAGDQRLLDVPWPGAPLAERGDIRRDVVVLYERACARLGLTPRSH